MSGRRRRASSRTGDARSPAHGARAGAPEHGVHACVLPPPPVPPPRRPRPRGAARGARGERGGGRGAGRAGARLHGPGGVRARCAGCWPTPGTPGERRRGRARRARLAGLAGGGPRRRARAARRRRRTRTPPRPPAREALAILEGRAAARPRLRRHPAAQLERARQGQDGAGRRDGRDARGALPRPQRSATPGCSTSRIPPSPTPSATASASSAARPGGELTPAPLLADGVAARCPPSRPRSCRGELPPGRAT